ncbi:MAG: glycosyltransferase [Candidatus Binataceae bacterium]
MKLSVIIATHARPAALARLVNSLAQQLEPDKRELLIADNGTPEPAALPATAPAHIHLHDPRPGKCRMQNDAIRAARGEIIVCLDDDLVAAPHYLDEVERFFEEHREFAAMKGKILAADDPRQKLGPEAVYLDLPIADHGERIIEVRGVLGANMAFRRSALDKVGLFDERLGPGAAGHEEETEMSARLRRAGLRIGYAPGAIVYHEVDPARADRDRFIRIARERGRCRTIHENHTRAEAIAKVTVARCRLAVAKTIGAGLHRIAREEKRLAIARGMLDGLREQ